MTAIVHESFEKTEPTAQKKGTNKHLRTNSVRRVKCTAEGKNAKLINVLIFSTRITKKWRRFENQAASSQNRSMAVMTVTSTQSKNCWNHMYSKKLPSILCRCFPPLLAGSFTTGTLSVSPIVWMCSNWSPETRCGLRSHVPTKSLSIAPTTQHKTADAQRFHWYICQLPRNAIVEVYPVPCTLPSYDFPSRSILPVHATPFPPVPFLPPSFICSFLPKRSRQCKVRMTQDEVTKLNQRSYLKAPHDLSIAMLQDVQLGVSRRVGSPGCEVRHAGAMQRRVTNLEGGRHRHLRRVALYMLYGSTASSNAECAALSRASRHISCAACCQG